MGRHSVTTSSTRGSPASPLTPRPPLDSSSIFCTLPYFSCTRTRNTLRKNKDSIACVLSSYTQGICTRGVHICNSVSYHYICCIRSGIDVNSTKHLPKILSGCCRFENTLHHMCCWNLCCTETMQCKNTMLMLIIPHTNAHLQQVYDCGLCQQRSHSLPHSLVNRGACIKSLL